MHNSSLLVIDYVGPAIGAALFVVVMSFVKEPTRRSFNAIFVAGASGVYLSGGFGAWELVYPAIAFGSIAGKSISTASSSRNRTLVTATIAATRKLPCRRWPSTSLATTARRARIPAPSDRSATIS